MTTYQPYPDLEPQSIAATRDALHAYSRDLGEWSKTCRPKRKHWWHASLRPSLMGLTTGTIHSGISFELQLNLRESLLQGRTSNGKELVEALGGQPAAELGESIENFLIAGGLDERFIPGGAQPNDESTAFPGYSAECADTLAGALSAVSAAMAEFRAGIREETSPIQLWPHHFDLSMLWLPGDKVSGQDPANEEYADKQMNFGFTFGDEGIPEPYLYVTAYPLPEKFPGLQLPAGTTWRTEGFSGAVLLYRSLKQSADPTGYLIDLWNDLLSAGREHMNVCAN